MSENQSGGGTAALLRALEVRKHARRGFAAGVAVTAAVFAFFVLLPGVERSPLLYLALAFVLALSLGGLVTMLLTAVAAIRLARRL